MPNALYRKYPAASRSNAWQFVFPSKVLRPWQNEFQMTRWHVSDTTIQRAFKVALNQAGVRKQRLYTLCAIRLLRIYLVLVLILGRFNYCWDIEVCKLQ
jgi:hypothetical protein